MRSLKKTWKLLALALSLLILASGISVYAADSNSAFEIKQQQENNYLTEEDIFAALASTYKNTTLQRSITLQTSANGKITFTSENFSDYTNNEYGGMYVDTNGNLTLCFKENTANLKTISEKNAACGRKLLNEAKKVIADSVQIKSVAYSQTELQNVYNYLCDYASEFPDIYDFYIDVVNNKISIGVYNTANIDDIKNILNTKFSLNMLSFREIGPNDKM